MEILPVFKRRMAKTGKLLLGSNREIIECLQERKEEKDIGTISFTKIHVKVISSRLPKFCW